MASRIVECIRPCPCPTSPRRGPSGKRRSGSGPCRCNRRRSSTGPAKGRCSRSAGAAATSGAHTQMAFTSPDIEAEVAELQDPRHHVHRVRPADPEDGRQRRAARPEPRSWFLDPAGQHDRPHRVRAARRWTQSADARGEPDRRWQPRAASRSDDAPALADLTALAGSRPGAVHRPRPDRSRPPSRARAASSRT